MQEKSKKDNRQQILSHLNQIIETQAKLAEASFDLDGFMQLAAEQVHLLTPATGTVVELVEDNNMVYRAATGSVAGHIGLHLSRKNSISGMCVDSKEVLYSEDTEVDSRVNVEACRKVGARSLVVAPLFHQGKAVGVIKILSKNPSAFSQTDIETLQLMAGLIGSALAHQISHDVTTKLLQERTKALEDIKKTEEKLKYMATYDYLTDLPNRSLFIDRLTQAITKAKRNKKILALFFLDIDHFKSINDTLGHDTGDQLLSAFASRLKQCIRSTDTAARFGGDEFVILLDEVPDQENVINIANKIIKKMQEPFGFQKNTFTITTSIGVSFLEGDISAEQLIKQADQALYQAKKFGRNTFCIYE